MNGEQLAEKLIGTLEANRDLSIEQFYMEVKAAMLALRERLNVAREEGVEID